MYKRQLFHGGSAPVLEDARFLMSNLDDETGIWRHLFRVKTDQNPSATLLVLERDGDVTIPWGPFYQAHEHTLEKFLRDRSSPPSRFFMLVTRAHNLQPPPTVPKEFHRFRMTGGIHTKIKIFTYADPASPGVPELLDAAQWDGLRECVVELAWQAESADTPNRQPVMITSCPDLSWDGG